MRNHDRLAPVLCSWAAFDPVLAVNAQATNGNQVTADAIMPVDRFWRLIDETTQYGADPERQIQAMHQILRALSLAEIEAFEQGRRRLSRQTLSQTLGAIRDFTSVEMSNGQRKDPQHRRYHEGAHTSRAEPR